MADFYPFKTNLDGSKTSICLHCFRTIGAGSKNLAHCEQEHICDPNDLQLMDRRRTSGDHAVIEFGVAKAKTDADDNTDRN